MAFEHFLDARFYNYPRPPRHYGLRRDTQTLVQRLRRGEILDLGRTTDVCNRREERRLDHRPQQHVGRQPERIKVLAPEALPAAARDILVALFAQPVAAQATFN